MRCCSNKFRRNGGWILYGRMKSLLCMSNRIASAAANRRPAPDFGSAAAMLLVSVPSAMFCSDGGFASERVKREAHAYAYVHHTLCVVVCNMLML